MKLIIDAHLPKSLASCFPLHDVMHTSEVAEGNQTPDRIINEISIREKRVVITKDTDFYYSFLSSGKPYKLVLVKLGNMRLSDLHDWFDRNAHTIVNEFA